MAVTQNTYTGNGSTVLFSFTFPYLDTTDIKVSLDEVVTSAYTLANATTIQFNTAPANGVAIRIYRVTDDSALAAEFFPGSAIRAQDLNDNYTQNLYVTQESNRDATSAIATANSATTTANTALSTANAASATATTADTNASAAVATANTASTNASTAVSTANTASSNATTAVNTANSAAADAATALSTANTALSTANTADTNASAAVATANTASTNASAAVSTANTASSNASSAVSTANTASSNASTALSTANTAISTANAAASAVATAVLYDVVANVAAIPSSPANNDAVEVSDSTGIESFTPLSGVPAGFVGDSGLSVRIVYTTSGSTWNWIQYFPNDPETRYGDAITTNTADITTLQSDVLGLDSNKLAIAGGTMTGALVLNADPTVNLGAATKQYVDNNLPPGTTVSDTAPSSPGVGDLWYDSVGGRLYVWYEDGTSNQWVDASPSASVDQYWDPNGSDIYYTGGRVGIGTTSVQAKLHVGGLGEQRILLGSTDAGGARLSLDGDSDGDGSGGDFAEIIHTTSGHLEIKARNPADDATMRFEVDAGEAFRIDASKRLLVETSTSTSVAGTESGLQVSGTPASMSVINAGGGANLLLARNQTVGNGWGLGRIIWCGGDGTNVIPAAQISVDTDGTPGSNDMPGRLVFSTTADGASSPTERMRISHVGTVSIGLGASVSNAFYVNGQADLVTLKINSASSGSNVTAQGFLNSSGNYVGAIYCNSSSTTYSTSSDYRLKQNVVPLTGAVDRLNQLQVHRFNFIADPSTTVDGFLAHEAQAVVPECVTGTKDEVDADGNPKYQGIDQSKLVPLITAALQEALAEIESLKAANTDLAARITALETN